MWRRAGSGGKLTLDQGKLAEEMNLSRMTISRVIHEMMAEGKMKKIGERKFRVSVYKVTDPEVWKWKYGGQ